MCVLTAAGRLTISTMTSRDRVLAAFAHEEPDRVPVWCGSSAEFRAKARRELGLDDDGLRRRFGDDFRRVFATHTGPALPALSEGAVSRTVFGIERHGLGYGQPMTHPLAAATLKDVDAYPWPDPGGMDVSGIREAAASFAGEYAILEETPVENVVAMFDAFRAYGRYDS